MAERRVVRKTRVVVNGRELTPDEIAALPPDLFDGSGSPEGVPTDAWLDALAGMEPPVRRTRVTSRVVDGRTGLEIGSAAHAGEVERTRSGILDAWRLSLGVGGLLMASAWTLAALWWVAGLAAAVAAGALFTYANWASATGTWGGNIDAQRVISPRDRLRLGFVQILVIMGSLIGGLLIASKVVPGWPWASQRFETQLETLTGRPIGDD